MKDELARTALIAVSPSGRRSRVSIEIGRAYEIRDGKGADCAACSVSIRGLGRHPRANPHRIMGEDTFQAVSIALAFVRLRLLDFVGKGGRLMNTDGSEFEVEPYFPRYEPEPNKGAPPDRVQRAVRSKPTASRPSRGS